MNRCTAKHLLLALSLASLFGVRATTNTRLASGEPPASLIVNATVPASTCYVEPLRIPAYSVVGSLSLTATPQLASGCSPSEISISQMYIYGVCLSSASNTCPPYTKDHYSEAFSRDQPVPSNDTSALCNQVFAEGIGNVVVGNIASTGVVFDSIALVCAESERQGLLFIQNNCSAGAEASTVSVNVNFSVRSSCSTDAGGAQWFWWIFMFAAIALMVFLPLACCILPRRKKAQQAQQAAQLAAMGSAPSSYPPSAPSPVYSSSYNVTNNQRPAVGIPLAQTEDSTAAPPAVGLPASGYGSSAMPGVWYANTGRTQT